MHDDCPLNLQLLLIQTDFMKYAEVPGMVMLIKVVIFVDDKVAPG
jgi:hypothetical protein